MSVNFCPIISGSSGNCVFVSSNDTRILVDAGASGKRIESGLSSIGENPENIDAILITHEHSDHIQGAGVLSRRYGIPIYASPGTWEAMERYAMIGRISPQNRMYVYAGENMFLNDVCVRPFEIPHDAAEPVGYSLLAGGTKVTVATDMGHITETVRLNVRGSEVLLIESNHDEDMLKNGRYPLQLKRRILSKRGHLSNISCGLFLSEEQNRSIRHVYLGHLSEENNLPTLAMETVANILTANATEGLTTQLHLADRYRAGRPLSLVGDLL